MALQVVTTSKRFSLTAPDWLKGLAVATLTTPITIIISSLMKQTWVIDWNQIGQVALIGFLGYITKNFLTGSQTTITGTPAPDTTTTVVIPPAAQLKAGFKPVITSKNALSLLFIMALSYSCNAQFFKPLPKPAMLAQGKFGLAADSIQAGFRPVVGVTAILSSGATLAGGVGVGWQSNKWDVASQTWVNQYSISGIAFLGSNGSSATVSAGLVFGFLNFMSLGPVYDFTSKKFGLATGVQLHFN